MLLRTCWRVGSDDAVIQIHHKYIWTIEFKVRSAKKGTPRHFVAVFREERRESRFKGQKRDWERREVGLYWSLLWSVLGH